MESISRADLQWLGTKRPSTRLPDACPDLFLPTRQERTPIPLDGIMFEGADASISSTKAPYRFDLARGLDTMARAQSGGRRWRFIPPLSRCPRRLRHDRPVERRTGIPSFPSCGALFCVYCGPRLARALAAAIELAEPTHFLTLTNVGDDFATVNSHMKALKRKLRCEWDWVVEEAPHNPSNRHVHAWVHSLDEATASGLQAMAHARGLGRVDLRPVTDSANGLYGYKTIALHGATLGVDHDRTKAVRLGLNLHLSLNNGRLSRGSREFFRDGAGGPVLTRREATALTRARWRDERYGAPEPSSPASRTTHDAQTPEQKADRLPDAHRRAHPGVSHSRPPWHPQTASQAVVRRVATLTTWALLTTAYAAFRTSRRRWRQAGGETGNRRGGRQPP